MADDTHAAALSFPKRTQEIQQLSARDESFHDLCVDFSVAKALLQKWESSPDRERDARYEEYLLLARELADEIVAALDAAVVIPFAKREK